MPRAISGTASLFVVIFLNVDMGSMRVSPPEKAVAAFDAGSPAQWLVALLFIVWPPPPGLVMGGLS
jgi:hypothetical protein